MTPRQIWAKDYAEKVLKDYDVTEWSFGWNRRKAAYGLCDYRKKEISLSIYYVEVGTEAQIINTILHELAHALAGPGTNHGEVWKRMCRKVGANPVRCGQPIAAMPSTYRGMCPVCKTQYKAHRKLKNMSFRFCGKTGCPAYTRKLSIEWEMV